MTTSHSASTIIDSRWQKAALLGSVWASIEIVVGSFLHNIKFPLTGTILSTMGIALLVAGHSLWKEKGIVWRAGLICAVMKSISPSSVILGPMIGIAGEAFIVEAAIRLFGGNTAGYLIGGAVACTTPVIQKTISYLFMYGMNVALLFDKLVEFAKKNLQVSGINSVDVIIAIIVVNLFWGAVAALIGVIVGKRAAIISISDSQEPMNNYRHSQILDESSARFSIVLLVLHLAVLISGLIIQSAFFLLYVPFCLIRYPHIRKKFKRWFFWVEIGVVSLIAGFVLGSVLLSNSTSGILIGLQMFFRAVFVVSIFSAVNVELRNPVIIDFLFKRKMKDFSRALDMAFGSLPSMIDALQREKAFLRHPIDSLSRILAHSFSMQQIENPLTIFILTGESKSGKTTLLQELIPKLHEAQLTVQGILQIGVWKNDTRYGFDILDLNSNESVPLCRTDAPDSGISAGPFKFFPDGIQFGKRALTHQSLFRSDVIIIDEIGPLELNEGGWAKHLSLIIEKFHGILILVIRTGLIDDVKTKFQIAPDSYWESGKISLEEILNRFSS